MCGEGGSETGISDTISSEEEDLDEYTIRSRLVSGLKIDQLRLSKRFDATDFKDIKKKLMEDTNYAVKRLEELILGTEEPKLSEDQLRINNELQEDELLAMESIYGDNVVILSRECGLRSFKIHVHVETSNDLTLSVELHSSDKNVELGGKVSTRIASSNYSNKFLYTFSVKYLPPIVLTCILPKSYPSHLPPYFTISVQWLDSMRISNLCRMLDSIWMKQPREEIIYQWVECLHSSSLSYLEIDREIPLGPYSISETADRRAVSESASPDVDIPSIMKFNDDKCHEVFCQSLHECYICLGEYAGIDFIRLPCNHCFCSKCMTSFARMHVKEGTVHKLVCPDSKCIGLVPPGFLRCLLTEEEFERWETLLLKKTLSSMPDIVYCPRCESVCLDDGDNHAQCPACFFSFCCLCKERRHVGGPCMTAEMKLKMLQEQQNSLNLSKSKEQVRLKQLLEKVYELRSIERIKRDAKSCPSCQMAISRIEGCNKMICSNCGQFFCYKCGQAINGYDHFSENECTVFGGVAEPKPMFEERINEVQDIARVNAENHPDHAHSCPLCGQLNVKMANNNHINCWSCRNHYCYLCREGVRNSSQHYRSKGCKQHTPG